jgi:O-antigen ligase
MLLNFLRKRSVHAWPIYGLCVFLPLSIAGIGIFKLFTILTALLVLVIAIARGQRLLELRTGPTVLALCMLGALAISLTYTSASTEDALNAFAKYGKLLLIPAVALLIRTRAQAITALRIYFCAQSFILLTSWLLFAGLTLPWVPGERNAIAVVYSSYLDQAILTAGFAALAWHLRADFSNYHSVKIGIFMAIFATLNLLFALHGRSGQICLIAAVAATIWWVMPSKVRPLAVLAPFFAFGFAMMISTQFNQRYIAVFAEVKAYQSATDRNKETSSGERLNYWHRSLEAMAIKPWRGHGVGAWQQQYWLIEGDKLSRNTASARNPHQEFLFWGVQLGALGLVILLSWLGSFWWATKKFETSVRHATIAFLVIFITACLFNSALYDGLVGDYFCALLAVLLALGRHTDPEVSRSLKTIHN